MKRFTLSIVISILFFSSGCDIIEEPYINSGVDTPDTGEIVQKVLLEEYTGHQCPNCPDGAEIIEQLKNFYGDKLVVIAYHAGFFARTSTGFTTDYRTSTGNELNTYYGIQSYPSGLVNRKDKEVLARSAWSSAVSSAINDEPILSIDLSVDYNNSNRSISVTAECTSLVPLSEHKVSIFIVENGIISPQLTADGVITDYEHNHVFRTSLNGSWGTTIFEEGSDYDEVQSITATGQIDPLWNDSNIEVICFVYNSNTENIIQVDAKPIL